MENFLTTLKIKKGMISLRRLSEPEACKLFRELISAVEYLHDIGCAHRDIKPSNILVDEEKNLKLIDFGLGNLYSDDEKLKTSCGSPCYAAPEVWSFLSDYKW